MDYVFKKGLPYQFGKAVRTLSLDNLSEIVKPAIADFWNRKLCRPQVIAMNEDDLKAMKDYFQVVDITLTIEPRVGLRLASVPASVVPVGNFALDVL